LKYRHFSRANAKDLARLENEVRQKIGKIYEKITGFVQQGVVDPKSIRVQFPNYEHLDLHQNRNSGAEGQNTPNPQISRNVTPEGGCSVFLLFCWRPNLNPISFSKI